MRLKSLELVGFKSFFEPTTISLASGITAVVGPNGCGKSNVVDAIRWILGEQAPTRLRGKTTEEDLVTLMRFAAPSINARTRWPFRDHLLQREALADTRHTSFAHLSS